MNRKTTVALVILIIAIIAGATSYAIEFEKNKQKQSQFKNSAQENTIPSSNAEINSNKRCTTAGKAHYPSKENCCEGLVTIFGSELPNGKCWCTEKDSSCGGTPICAPCGNGECEKEYGEDKCNCPIDCT